MKASDRTCMLSYRNGEGYCGRTSSPIVTAGSTCEDCHAAFRADQRAEKAALDARFEGGTR